MTDHMTAAMEAGAKALEGHLRVDSYLDGLADRVITAAEPHIRAMVAEEIEDHIGRVFGGRPNSSLTTSEMIAKTSSVIAARIAKGPQQ